MRHGMEMLSSTLICRVLSSKFSLENCDQIKVDEKTEEQLYVQEI